ncbi:MAG TPA: glycosyltransferase family 2 protein [Anaerolineaceae bacterium]|nr:glycosyltransferase family 2 protein [Anaerolineaceae bacterium]
MKISALLSLSVVVPVYNSQATLHELVSRLGKALPELTDTFEVLLINDGSRDDSWGEITRLAREYPWVRGINMMRNYGQHNALLCGLRNARYAVTITMDDDLQHPPEEIHKLVEKYRQGFDVVYGVPVRLPHSPMRNFFSWITKRTLAFVMGISTVREISAFRCFRTSLRHAFENYQSPNVIIDVLLSWGTTNFGSTRVEEKERQVGQSNYNFSRLAAQAMFILTGFSTAPLRFTSYLGFGFTLFGIGIFIYVVTAYLLQGSIPGFPFLASIISIFSGVQMFALGILGEYLGRVFDRSMDRPTYVIDEITEQVSVGELAEPER